MRGFAIARRGDIQKQFRLRGHHTYCFWFLKPEFSAERGPEAEAAVKRLLDSPDSCIQIVQGIDDICLICPLRAGERCESPHGNEEEVRKFDAIVLKGLDLSYGQTLSWGEWRQRVMARSPLPFCQRCKWRASCSSGQAGG